MTAHRQTRREPPRIARIRWRPSLCIVSALGMLTLLAPVAIATSAMPSPWSIALALIAVHCGAHATWREARKPPRRVAVRSDGAAHLDGRPLATASLHWRGPLAFIDTREPDGRRHRLSWWPDTLNARERRALRLAAPPLPVHVAECEDRRTCSSPSP